MHIFLVIVIAMNIIQAMSSKTVALHLDGSKQYISFTLIRSVISTIIALVLIFIVHQRVELTSYTLLLGVLGGLALGINYITGLAVMKKGSIAFVNVFSLSGMFIPTIYGWFFMDVAFNIYHFLGLIAMILAATLMVGYNSSIKGKTDAITVILAVVSLITNGTVMLSQNLFTHLEPLGESAQFNLVLFGTSAIILLIVSIYQSIKDKGIQNLKFKLNAKISLMLLLLGGSVFVISLLMTDLTSKMPPSILFPLVSGLSLICTTIASAITFKEKIKTLSIISIFITICGIILLQL